MVWIIETKGGQTHGKDKNIDPQAGNKFNAFKNYAEGKNISWGFVRNKDNIFYMYNTVFAEDMADENWVPIAEKF